MKLLLKEKMENAKVKKGLISVLSKKLDLLSKKYKKNIPDLLVLADESSDYNEDFLEALSLHRKISALKSL